MYSLSTSPSFLLIHTHTIHATNGDKEQTIYFVSQLPGQDNIVLLKNKTGKVEVVNFSCT